MPRVGSARRVLSISMGISAIFDVTGASVLRLVRRSLPEPPPPGSRPDPFQAAMDTIMEAHREVAPHGPGSGGGGAPRTLDESASEAAPDARTKIGVTLPA
jgi:hypothetical protein